MMEQVLLVTGGYISISWAKEYLRGKNFAQIVVADGGIRAAKQLGLVAHILVGDFDSATEKEVEDYLKWLAEKSCQCELFRLPCHKAVSDTEAALDFLLSHQQKKGEIHILGATGTRLDHVLANIHILCKTLKQRISTWIVDEHNRIRLVDKDTPLSLKKAEQYGKYLSLFPLTTEVTGICASGVAYPLWEATLVQGISLGVSNEIQEEIAEISVKEGIMIVIESRD